MHIFWQKKVLHVLIKLYLLKCFVWVLIKNVIQIINIFLLAYFKINLLFGPSALAMSSLMLANVVHYESEMAERDGSQSSDLLTREPLGPFQSNTLKNREERFC